MPTDFTPDDLQFGTDELTPGQQYQNTTGSSQSSSYFNDPEVASAMTKLLGGVAAQTGGQYADFINNPTAHPIYQNALGGLLGSLKPSEDQARMGLNDQFRAAGNTASSSYGHAAQGLESNILRNRQTTASNLLTTLFPQVAGALMAPLAQTPAMVGANKLQQETAQNTTQAGSVQSPREMGSGGGVQMQQGYRYDNTGMGAVRGGAGSLVPVGQTTIQIPGMKK